MSVKCSDIILHLERKAPPSLAEEWDNVGLMAGSMKKDVNRIMICLDVTENVVNEAIEKNIDMIISHHPLIFSRLKNINDTTSKGRLLLKLIKNDICVYSMHTNLDVAEGGVNDCLAEALKLKQLKSLSEYKKEKLYKIAVFIPVGHEDAVRDAMSNAGAGWIGKYSDCTFMVHGTGTFKPMEGTNPYIGKSGVLEKVHEIRLETIVPENRMKNVIDAMIKAHPYEEVAYDIYPLEIAGKEFSLGKVGQLDEPLMLDEFIVYVKKSLKTDYIRLIGSVKDKISRVAVFCGSFDESVMGNVKSKADVLVTSDIKYHTALEFLENDMCVIDAGHFSTERVVLKKLADMIIEKYPDLYVVLNTVEEDPFKYC
mgnify:CR=1 FL=1